MQRQSYQVKTVLEQKGARKKTFLAFKDSLGNPLSRSPIDKGVQIFLLYPVATPKGARKTNKYFERSTE